MTELIELARAPGVLLLAIVIFSIAPGLVLRLTVLLYPKNDERRKELIAELYAMPRLQRPFWVGEQFETAIFDGLQARRVDKRRTVLIYLVNELENDNLRAELMGHLRDPDKFNSYVYRILKEAPSRVAKKNWPGIAMSVSIYVAARHRQSR